MQRNVVSEFQKWYDNGCLKPIILTGVRGCGKTYSAHTFTESVFRSNVYVNLNNTEDNEGIIGVNENCNLLDILEGKYEIGPEIVSNTAFIFDEADYKGDIFRAIRQYAKNDERSVIVPLIVIFENIKDISLLFDENSKSEINNFEHIHMSPMGFDEFLTATGHEWYKDIITAHFANMKKIPDIVHTELLDLFDEYLTTGGMPISIREYLELSGTYNCLNRIKDVYLRCLHDLNEISGNESDAHKMEQLIENIGEQLVEGKRYKLNSIRKGVTNNYFQSAIRLLENSGNIVRSNRVYKINSSDIITDESKFKMYYSDLGLIHTKVTSMGENLQVNIRRALIENYIATVLDNCGYKIMFWESDSIAAVDFVICNENNSIIPIDVRSSGNNRSKSMSVFMDNYKIGNGIKIYDGQLNKVKNVINIPYYAIFCINEQIRHL